MQTVLRVAALYFFILISMRVMGKREFAELSPFDLVMLLLVSEIASQGMIMEDFSVTNAMIGLSTLFLLVFLTSSAAFGSKRVRAMIGGSPVVLVDRGRLVADNLTHERIPPDAVYGEMHRAGYADLSRIRWAILETDGKISFVPFEQNHTNPTEESAARG